MDNNLNAHENFTASSMTDKDELKDECVWNPNLLAEFAQKCIGPRSITEFAKMSNLSSSFLSRLINGKLPARPSQRSILKLVNCAPRGVVSLSEVLNAAGYVYETSNYNSKTFEEIFGEVPSYAKDRAFTLTLLINALAAKDYVDNRMDITLQSGLFVIKQTHNKDIIGLSAICDFDSVKVLSQSIKMSFLMAIDLFKEELKTICFVIITNQDVIYEEFGKDITFDKDMEIYTLLTKDYRSFSNQRIVTSSTKTPTYFLENKPY